jgi:prevent-host-death family protein
MERFMAWPLKEAKQKFSEVVRRAVDEGPQVITRDDEEIAVVISADEYRRIMERKPTFKEFLLSAPDMSMLETERSKEPAHVVDFDL